MLCLITAPRGRTRKRPHSQRHWGRWDAAQIEELCILRRIHANFEHENHVQYSLVGAHPLNVAETRTLRHSIYIDR